MEEQWRELPEYPGYKISSLGRVMNKRGSLMKQVDNPGGYPSVHVGKTVVVSVLVAKAFHGPKPTPEHHAAHNNGNKHDNSAENIAWKTIVENFADKLLHGTLPKHETHWNSRLTKEDVEYIRANYKRGNGQKLAEKFGVSNSYLIKVVKKLRWKDY